MPSLCLHFGKFQDKFFHNFKKGSSKEEIDACIMWRNINIIVEEHVSSENIHFDIVVDDEARYTINSSQQTVEQIEVIQVVLAEASKLNDSVMKEK